MTEPTTAEPRMTIAAWAAARHRAVGASGTRRSLRAMVAAALGILPLTELFTDVRWFFDAAGAIIVVSGTAAALRWWYRPRVLHTWIGLALLVPWLVWRFTGTHAVAGFIPTRATWHDVSGLLGRVRDTTKNGVAPVRPDEAITLVLAALAGLVAAFVDFVAVIGRRAALAGIPLLVVFTVAGAVPRHPVPWLLFGSAAAGFLLLLSIDARDEVRGWGRIIPRAGESRPSAALGVSGPRIAVIATLIALALPFLIPTRASNLLANALHNSSAGGAGGGFGAGGISLDPFAALKGELQKSKPISLFTVTVSPSQTDSVSTPRTVAPYYLRANVLNAYSEQGWTTDSHGSAVPASAEDFRTEPAIPPSSTAMFSARIDVTGLGDNAPVFAQPTSLTGTDDRTTWSPTDAILLGHNVGRGDQITEDVAQPDPTVAQLAAAPDAYSAQFAEQYGKTTGVTAAVKALVGRLTAGKSTPYGKALALNNYFTDPANGFRYSLQTKPSDDITALDSFLSTRTGYCQQYAASMAIMLRVAGVPARVVLGYTHSAPDSSGAFTVTTNNAHAWAEAYFVGIGWLPFDTTPIVSSPGAATATLAWAPRPIAATPTDLIPTRHATAATPSRRPEATANSGTSVGAGQNHRAVPWPLLGSLLALLLLMAVAVGPAGLRLSWRRRRLRAGRRGNPDALWDELIATATDLGYVWSNARTPRQVADWLGVDIGQKSAGAMTALANAVEQSRYAPAGAGPDSDLVPALHRVESELRVHRSNATRIRSRVLPRSLALRSRSTRRH